MDIKISFCALLLSALLSGAHAGPIVGFYHVFLRKIDYSFNRSINIVHEQMETLRSSGLLGATSRLHVRVICADADCPLISPPEPTIVVSYQRSGDEYDTLTSLWALARRHENQGQPQASIYYIHSKGSFHPGPRNDRFRRGLMQAVVNGWRNCTLALERHGATTCGMRFWPFPHPHFAGNMWWALSSYVAAHVAPMTYFNTFPWDPKCKLSDIGRQRYGAEHWIGASPHNVPFDCIGNSLYIYGYDRLDQIAPVEYRAALPHLASASLLARRGLNADACYRTYVVACNQMAREMDELFGTSLGQPNDLKNLRWFARGCLNNFNE